MVKSPAFLFYSSDFLSGITDLTMEERGQYITLLCLQHQKGHLSEKTIRLSVGSVSVDVLSKFNQDEEGNFYNKRLKDEMWKRENFTQSRRKNGQNGGRPPKKEEPSAKPLDKPLGYALGLASENLPDNENDNEDINKDKEEEKGKYNYAFDSEFFKKSWHEWVVFRKEKKQKLTPSTITKQMELLSKQTEQVAIQMIQTSITNGWIGLFKPKETFNSGKKDGLGKNGNYEPKVNDYDKISSL